MKTILRICGTWLIGLTLVLLVVDGTRTLGANRFEFTSIKALWSALDAVGFVAAREALAGLLAPVSADALATAFFSTPGAIVTAILGFAFLVVGRRRGADRYVDVS